MLSLTEYLMKEPLPRAVLHEAIFDFVREHDFVVFGAQAVNRYVPDDAVRMTADVDFMSPTPKVSADALALHLHQRFHLAARVREVKESIGFRVYQARAGELGDRHLADVRRSVDELTLPWERIEGIRLVALPELVVMKLGVLEKRKNTAKGATDLADLQRLLLTHPDLREEAAIEARIDSIGFALTGVDPATLRRAWNELRAAPLEPDDDEW